MKLSKKQETEVLKVYEVYFDSYINGDVHTIDSLLDDDYNQIGSAESEVFFNKKDAMHFLRETIDQVAGRTEIRNRVMRVDLLNEYFLVTDLFDIYAEIEEDWSFYSKFRASTLMQKKEDGWKFIHQHSSMPDTRTEEGENIAIEKISAENLQLREAVKRRTIELENKNRELAIEAALERIRSKSMAMHATDGLAEVIETVFKQFELLNVRADSCFINIHQPDSDDWNLWVSTGGRQTYQLPVLPYLENPVFRQQLDARKKSSTFYTGLVDKKAKDQFFDHFFNHLTGLEVSKDRLGYIYNAKGIATSFTLSKHATIALANYSCIPYAEEENLILQRIGHVFEQTYRRFLDLQKAEAQAREAQIEAALEKVRSCSMGVHKSEQLIEVVRTLDKVIIGLEIEVSGTQIITDFGNREKGVNDWYARDGQDYLEKFHVPHIEHSVSKRFDDALEKGVDFYTDSYSKDEKNEYFKLLFKYSDFRITPKERQDHVYNSPGWLRAVVLSNNSILIFQRFNLKEFSKEEEEIFKRFGKVFEQAYTRFLDLQKAEAQARESEIQLALERVRARTMAMHKSEELAELNAVILQQVRDLNVEIFAAGIHIADPNKPFTETWIGDPVDGQMPRTVIDHSKDPLCDRMYRGWKEGATFKIELMEGIALKKHFQNMAAIIPDQKIFEELVPPNKLYFHLAYFSYGFFVFTTIVPCPENHDIFQRFAKVFEQTYTRFLDLQKAEAQAREAQIEMSLERIRAKAMAMRTSTELMSVADTIREQMRLLGQPELESSMVLLYDEEKFTEEDWFAFLPPKGSRKKILKGSITWRLDENAVVKKLFKIYKSGIRESTFNVKGKDLEELFKDITEKFPAVVEYYDGELPENVIHYVTRFSGGHILMTSQETPNEKSKELQRRITNTFDLAYKRFLDLQKAEAQAREAQIEASLERVRAKAMAMHKSEELNDVATVLFQQIRHLGGKLWTCGIVLCQKDSEVDHFMVALENGMAPTIEIPNTKDPATKNMYHNWKNGADYYVEEAGGKDLKKHYDYLETLPTMKPVIENLKASGTSLPTWQKWHAAYFTNGYLMIITLEPYPQEEVFTRFAKVFEQAYTRFLDLKKAEAQAREAQIEAALERVRARTMAMHKSEELAETAAVLFQQLNELGVKPERINIGIVKEEERIIEWWSTEQGGKQISQLFKGSIDEPTTLSKVYAAWKSGKKSMVLEQSGKELTKWLKYLTEELGLPFKEELRHKRRYQSTSYFTHGIILMTTPKPLPEETISLLPRFAKVFEQTYTRFLDLQKAEAQAREAQIEAGLERIRAKALAMQSSADLHGVSTVLREQMGLLGQPELESSIVHLYNSNETLESWYTFRSTETHSEKIVTDVAIIPVDSCDYIKETIEKYNSDESEYTIISKGKKLADWYNVMVKVAPDTIEYDERGKILIPEILYYHHSKFSGGALLLISNQPPAEESKELQRRAARVFNFAYQRFLDLKRAEAQAREAQIEAALERVRSRAMAMHNSSDLPSTASVVFTELRKLGIKTMRSGISIHNKANRNILLYTATQTKDGDELSVIGTALLDNHPVLSQIYDSWLHSEDYFPELKGELLKTYYKQIASNFKVPKEQTETEQYGYFISFTHGLFYGWSKTPFVENERQLLKRFASVVDLTFKRYFDLQKAEAQARESIKQASLDRVRGEIASMRTTSDLEQITPLIWNELNIQGIPFIRCGVFIMEEEKEIIHNYLSSPDGKAIAAFHLPYTTPGAVANILKNWQEQKVFLDHWDVVAMKEFADILVNQRIYKSPDQYLATLPKDGFYLHFLPFNQGMLYVGNTTQLKKDEVQLIQSLANAFSTAYARYEDFKKLEEAKVRVENTLIDLKAAQSQLIQSEKMASLGELTAGIAHEIQNPLNFVNNFSEVSEEMIDEMNEELSKGDIEEVRAISDDLKQNLQKIHHHGQRASGIVKGMLEHSRTSDGKKELTDINALADEYLRLAYHGLRAKDNAFNADFKTDFDPSLPKVNVIPQDIGRLLLNLINNAFYAVDKKAARHQDPEHSEGEGSGAADNKSSKNNFRPELVVSTRKLSNSIEISVKDNGPGIPADIKDKIFQPFFTTKPTGSGTGLGLSLSYDIVKAHGGELKVETKEGEGSEFIIQLPAYYKK